MSTSQSIGASHGETGHECDAECMDARRPNECAGGCDFVEYREEYGADRDGNRGEWYTFVACRKCGEPQR